MICWWQKLTRIFIRNSDFDSGWNYPSENMKTVEFFFSIWICSFRVNFSSNAEWEFIFPLGWKQNLIALNSVTRRAWSHKKKSSRNPWLHKSSVFHCHVWRTNVKRNRNAPSRFLPNTLPRCSDKHILFCPKVIIRKRAALKKRGGWIKKREWKSVHFISGFFADFFVRALIILNCEFTQNCFIFYLSNQDEEKKV